MGAGEDFNPAFSFDVGTLEGPAQAPWEFGGALKMALKDHPGSSTIDEKISKRLQERQQGAKGGKQGHGKQQQQQQQQQQNGKKQQQQQQGPRKRQREEEEEEDSEDSDSDVAASDSEAGSEEDGLLSEDSEGGAGGGGSSSEEEEDAPLPGELDDGDSDDAVVSDEDSDEESDEQQQQQQQAGVKSSRQQQQQQQNGGSTKQPKAGSVAAAAAARKAAMANGAGDDSDGGDSSSDEDGGGGSSDEEEAGGKRNQRQEQQQQKQKQTKQHQAAAAGGAARKGKAGFYAETQRGFKQDERTFQDLNLSRPLLRAVAALGYTQPTPIQAACIPLALAGRDICGSAVTGSGKTAAFTLPILERLLYRPRQVAATYVLILSPTRELAAQIHSMFQKLAQFTDIDAALVVGGLSLQAQAAVLRAGPAVVVATPGRIIDHVRNSQGFGLEDLAVLVLDEADRLLEMGFKEELRELLRLAPRNRQTMLFSATFNDDVQQLASLSLKSPVRLAADPTAAAPETLSQEVIRLKGSSGQNKEAVLLALASRSFSGGRTIIFCETKQRAHRLKILFGLCELPPAAELHGDMTQAARLQSLEKFRKGEVAFLLATDVAARGLDILGLQVVLNYDAPRNLETYLHRVGRTARAGSEGLAVSFITDDDRGLLKSVVKQGRVQLKQRLVPQQAITRWQATLESVERDVERVLAEEREETALRKAEMEANKAQNMLDHESQIFSRPARTWFQTEKEKSAAAAAAAAAAQGKTVMEMDAADGAAGGSSKAAKAAAKSAAKQDKRNARLKEQRAAEAAAGGKKRVSELKTETEQFNKAIKGVKSRARSLMQQGMTAKAAQKMAQKTVTGVSTSHQKKKRKTSTGAAAGSAANGDADAGGLFAGDGTGRQPAAGGGSSGGSKGRGGKGGAAAGAKGGLSKTERNRIKRGGKGASSFKSKKKFKRR